jgi:hypothetical protein
MSEYKCYYHKSFKKEYDAIDNVCRTFKLDFDIFQDANFSRCNII